MFGGTRKLVLCALAATVLTFPSSDPAGGQSARAAQSSPPPAAVRPVPVGAPGTEVASAKLLITRLKSVRSMSGLAEMFTNETAGFMGIMLTLPIAMVVAFADAFSEMGEGMAKQMGGKPAPPSAKSQAEKKQLKQIQKDLEALYARYGMDPKSGPAPGAKGKLPPGIVGHGRAFMRDVAALLDRLPGKHSDTGALKSDMPPSAEKLKYTVLSSTRVRIVDPRKPKERIEARVEDGAWRLHLPDIETQMQQGMKPTAAPPTRR